MKNIARVWLVVYLLVAAASAQKLYVTYSGQDSDLTGERVVFAFKEAVRGSHTYSLTDTANIAGITVDFISAPVKVGNQDLGSALSFVVHQDLSGVAACPFCQGLIDEQLIVVSAGHENEMAQSLLATLDSAMTKYRAQLDAWVERQSPTPKPASMKEQ